MEIRVNLKDIPSNEVGEGVYLVRVEKMEVLPSKSTPGAEVINTEFNVMDGDHANRKVWDNFSLQPQALWRLRDFVQALGVFPGQEGFRTEECIGKMTRVMRTKEKGKDGVERVKNSEYTVVG